MESGSASDVLEYVLASAIRDGLIVRYQTCWSEASVLVRVTFPVWAYHRVSAAAFARDLVRQLGPWKIDVEVQGITDAQPSAPLYERLHRISRHLRQLGTVG
ncbi:hypothetical protein GCM10008957_03460 [Deinococcus ruber]|uniref:Uncharacterized protein n=1 Tax=Deinococcus ruber TaxID=1848197 RepID=A0A918F271_9DEIO|nr:hypothetical protein GCM10008957_03460 [Deinococcus ruber]